ncbi:hypothetical protein WICMUC_002272 [Wickerhamomyces mucosus]|uniref:C2H2-type domain-containing protein n=1 Tax=Wickerhamomyces mucosus TaxID=1378264 RepID=A0A9P8TEJ9_9ASCO|nr:hypothetical protein WICMUC_002272 [Wickerhamomyces mucosus]
MNPSSINHTANPEDLYHQFLMENKNDFLQTPEEIQSRESIGQNYDEVRSHASDTSQYYLHEERIEEASITHNEIFSDVLSATQTDITEYSPGLEQPDFSNFEETTRLSQGSLQQMQKSKTADDNENWFNPVSTSLEPLPFNLKPLNVNLKNNMDVLKRVNERSESLMIVNDENLPTSIQGFDSSPTVSKQFLHSSKFVTQTPLLTLSAQNYKTTQLELENKSSNQALFQPKTRTSRISRKPSKDNDGISKPTPNPRSGKTLESKYSTRPEIPITAQLKQNKIVWEKIYNNKKKGIYPCTHCSETFSNMYDLAKHIDEFGLYRKHRCPFDNCPWYIIGLPRRAEVRRHCAAQHNYRVVFPEDKTIKVNGELSTVGSKLDDLGFEGIHGTRITKNNIKCNYEFCHKTFKRKDARQRHENLVHLNPESRFNKKISAIKAKCEGQSPETLSKLVESSWNKKSKRKKEDKSISNIICDGD